MSRGWLWGALAVLVLAAGSYALYRHLEPRPLPPGEAPLGVLDLDRSIWC